MSGNDLRLVLEMEQQRDAALKERDDAKAAESRLRAKVAEQAEKIDRMQREFDHYVENEDK